MRNQTSLQHGQWRQRLLRSSRSFSQLAANRNRWLPVAIPTPAAPTNPRKGWRVIQKWKDSIEEVEPATGCSELVRALRRAQRQPQPQSLWRRAAHKGGQLAPYLRPVETCEILQTLADAKLQWRYDVKATEGLERFAVHASQELGSYAPRELAALATALAKLGFHHDDLLSSLTLAVERAAQVEIGRMDNASLCAILEAYRRFALVDEPMLRCLSRLLQRRLVREPLSAAQTSGAVKAFADLQARDAAFFNAATVALSRFGQIDELSWHEVADVAVSYASLRFFSETIHSRICGRVRAASGSGAETTTAENEQGVISQIELLREQFWEAEPPEPTSALSLSVVCRLLEAQVHWDKLSRHDVAHLLPQIVRCRSEKLSAANAAMVATALSRGRHAWPWLWYWVFGAFGAESSSASSLVLMQCCELHIKEIWPLLENLQSSPGRRSRLGAVASASQAHPVHGHVLGLLGALIRLCRSLARGVSTMSNFQLTSLLEILADFGERRPVLSRTAAQALGADQAIDEKVGLALARLASAAGAELAYRRGRAVLTDKETRLLAACEATTEDAFAAAQVRTLDSIRVAATVEQ